MSATCGRKASTLPTPPSTPPTSRSETGGDTPSAGSHPERPAESPASSRSIQLLSASPGPPKQTPNIPAIAARKIGKASRRCSTAPSIRSVRVPPAGLGGVFTVSRRMRSISR